MVKIIFEEEKKSKNQIEIFLRSNCSVWVKKIWGKENGGQKMLGHKKLAKIFWQNFCFGRKTGIRKKVPVEKGFPIFLMGTFFLFDTFC